MSDEKKQTTAAERVKAQTKTRLAILRKIERLRAEIDASFDVHPGHIESLIVNVERAPVKDCS